MRKINKANKYKNPYVQAKGHVVLLFVAQIFLMVLAFLATYTPVHAEDMSNQQTKSVVNDEKIVETLGAFQKFKKTEKNETTSSVNSNGYFIQLISGLAIVLLSIVVLAWIAKRFNRMQSPGGGNLRIVEGISMGARERVVVVEVDGKRLLLGVSPGRINMLHALGQKEQADDTSYGGAYEENDSATFSQKIAAAMMKERS